MVKYTDRSATRPNGLFSMEKYYFGPMDHRTSVTKIYLCSTFSSQVSLGMQGIVGLNHLHYKIKIRNLFSIANFNSNKGHFNTILTIISTGRLQFEQRKYRLSFRFRNRFTAKKIDSQLKRGKTI